MISSLFHLVLFFMYWLLQPCLLNFFDVKVTYKHEASIIIFFFTSVCDLYWFMWREDLLLFTIFTDCCNVVLSTLCLFDYRGFVLVFMLIVRFWLFLVTFRREEKIYIFLMKIGVSDLLRSVNRRLSRLRICYEIYIISSSEAHKSFGELKVIYGWSLASVADSNWENGNLDGCFRTMSSKYHGYYLLHSIHMVSWFSWCTPTLSMTWNC